MTAEREMTLEEWVGRLPEIHRARRELAAKDARIAELEADVEWVACVNPRVQCDDRGWMFVTEVDAVPAKFYDGTAAGLRAAVRRARKGEG